MVGMGMIFDETYRPFFEQAHRRGVYDRIFGDVDVPLTAVASRTGTRAAKIPAVGRQYRSRRSRISQAPDAVAAMLASGVDFACVATPDDRHFDAARTILQAGCHVLIEKPSVLRLDELDELLALCAKRIVLAKVVYHKLLDPDHKKLRTLVADGVCGTSTMVIVRCWSPNRSPGSSSPNGSAAAIRELTSPSTTSS